MAFAATTKQSEPVIQLAGEVIRVLPGGVYRVELSSGRQLLAPMVGRLRHKFVRVAVGDLVNVEMSAFDLEHGRIVGPLEPRG